ncbi:hypothetical protein ASPWEDRAFT_341528 [Aspergillus wentii DTO 134E9]|uniref:AAA+ ATPase domain-containing protein n=1 Tax=Aspergillus wentii DTO 134E9 TaxID=1073089 RepID=A0A1L9RUX9_ASPWE|nr:uncharacterized protein ASPWEDRAFT_341528 [Aspergillus wentii DTO 134E9]KAI9928656.1 hypothetical protein MW887_001872 [Aspergillus wentii]OJJ38741.1 hypothetical protein ASPWEDRAFT_341528 [Aspergillus wentii DTO 134E9]
MSTPPNTNPNVSTEKEPDGSECTIQTLYEGTPKCSCCKNWVEEYPKDLRTAVEEKAETKQKALVVRMRKNHGEGKALVLDSVVIQNASLKKTLSEVFEGYRGITTSLNKVVFRAPFRPFFYRWKRFTRILERQERGDPDAAAYSRLLYDVLHTELRDVMAEVNDLLAHGVITYSLLWALFEPAVCVVAAAAGQDRFFIIDSAEYNDKGFLGIQARFVDWDGQRFGYATGCLAIGAYSGTRRITDLGVFPASFHPAQKEAEERAILRGQKFRDLHGFHYKAYSGLMLEQVQRKQVKRNVDGRVIIDAASYFHDIPDEAICLAALDSAITPQINVSDDQHVGPLPMAGRCRIPALQRGDRLGQNKLEIGELTVEERIEPVLHTLTDKQLLLCTTHVRGYSLKTKSWGKFNVDQISDITWNDDAFPNLMLPTGYKNLILSFLEGQSANKGDFDDIIQGKGLGIIMLLVGNPGTGKTLTAEAVADKMRKPLYILSAGELGHNAKPVESRLNTVLELTEKWDAILLFDECDVFLQERSMSQLTHNEIVAVFLRLLEYYRGILFMTTNRADSIDRAFQSRIHLTLHYPDLEPTPKDQIWRRFVSQSKGASSEVTDEEYQRLALLPMNGRQIKNVVKISNLLAIQEKRALKMEQIRTVLHATREIDAELHGI